MHANAADRRGTHAAKNRAPRQRHRQEAVAARRAPAARRSARAGRRCGGTAAPCTGRSRAATTSSCRRRSSAARCGRRSREKMKDGALVVVDALQRDRGQDQGGRRDAEAAGRHRQGGPGRRRGRREAVAIGAQHPGRDARGERARHRARRRSTPASVVGDAGRAREAAGGAGA